jgi:hypothetical protein
MKRGSFLKTLIGIAIAPKVLAEVKEEVPVVKPKIKITHEKHKIGDTVMFSENRHLYRITSTYGDMRTAMPFNREWGPTVMFSKDDNRFIPIYTAATEKS